MRCRCLLQLFLVTLLLAQPLSGAEPIDPLFLSQALERTRTDPDSTVSVFVDAPVDYVFNFLTRRPDDYLSDAVSVAFDHSGSAQAGQLNPGSLRRIGLSSGEFLIQRFLLFNAPASYAYYTDMESSTASVPLDYAVTRYELSSEGGGTRLQVNAAYRASSRLLAFFVRRAFDSALQTDFGNAAQVIEAAFNGADR